MGEEQGAAIRRGMIELEIDRDRHLLRGAVGLKAELRPAGVLTAENGFLEEKLGD